MKPQPIGKRALGTRRGKEFYDVGTYGEAKAVSGKSRICNRFTGRPQNAFIPLTGARGFRDGNR